MRPLLLAVALLTGCAVACGAPPGLTDADRLQDALGGHRLTLGWLSANDRHRPFEAARTAWSPDTLPPAARAAYLRLASRPAQADAPSAAGVHHAIAAMAVGQWREADALLAEAASRDERAWQPDNDRAALWLTLAEQAGDQGLELWSRALDAALRASQKAPDTAAPWFNVLVAATRLGLKTTQARAVAALASRPPVPQWMADPAVTPPVAASPPADVVFGDLLDPARPRDPRLVDRVLADAGAAREFLLTSLYPAWATAWVAHGPSEVLADTALSVSRALEQIDGDPMFRQCSELVDAASRRATPPAVARALARGHGLYAEARRLYELNRRPESSSVFDAARASLAAAGSACAVPAQLEVALGTYQTLASASARRVYTQVSLRAGEAGQLARSWILGRSDRLSA